MNACGTCLLPEQFGCEVVTAAIARGGQGELVGIGFVKSNHIGHAFVR